MTTWALLAPGPSASAELAERLRPFPLGAIGCAYQIAPWARFVAATDAKWWRTYPEAKAVPGYSMHAVAGVQHARMPSMGIVNSGVLGLEVAKRLGATTILLCGFDMHGTHFFGPYRNGLNNTTEARRRTHLQQYAKWAKANPTIGVYNLTSGSSLKCFPTASLDDFCPLLQMGDAGVSGEVHGGTRQHPPTNGAAELHQAA